MSKKAIIEVQFNWIFVMIAGALILLFFVSIVTKQKQISDDRISSVILIDLEAILTGAKVSTGTVNIVNIPKTEVDFECNKYSVGRLNIEINDKIIFSPDLIKGRELITWTLDWNVPFWITNFLYLTTPEVRYIVVNESDDEDFADKIFYDWLPEEVNKEFVHLGALIEDKNNYRVKFVFVNQEPNISMLTDLRRMTDSHVKAIKIEPDSNTVNTGNITFYEKKGEEWREEGVSYYIKKEALIGAIFAHDLESYDCSMEKAFTKLNIMAAIYENRSTYLMNYYGAELCSVPHQSAVVSLGNIITRSLSFNKENIDVIYGEIYSSNKLQHQNGVAQLYSCVLIY